jgi:pSer/pThr/pTyr-binding forkhead associated (FHA) protein
MRTPSRPPPQRPAAPDLNFLPKVEAVEERILCPLCGSRNQRSVRFCVTCGHLLAHPSGSRDSSFPKPLPSSAPPPPVALAPAIELGDPRGGVRAYICPKCRGICEGPGQFCRFCGHSLAEAAIAIPPQPALAAPMEAPVPPGPVPATSGAVSAFGVARSQVTGATMPIPAPTPAPSVARFRLVLVARDGSEGASFPLGETTDIGRSEGDIVIADDHYISPRHARVTLRGGAYFLRDLASTNGVFVRIPFAAGSADHGRVKSADHGGDSREHESVPEQPLADQELFLVGQQVLRFEVVKRADEGFGVASENGTLVFGTPAAPRYARITQRTVEGVVRDVFHVRKAETVIGRESGDVVFTDDPFLSRRHAVVRVHNLDFANPIDPTFGLADLGSSNGTFLKIHDEVRLQRGMHFRIGQQLLRFDADPGVAGA